MNTFETLRELPKCDTQIRSKQMLLGKWGDGFARRRVATNLQFVTNPKSVKCNKVEANGQECGADQGSAEKRRNRARRCEGGPWRAELAEMRGEGIPQREPPGKEEHEVLLFYH